jgi:hypothetical protein
MRLRAHRRNLVLWSQSASSIGRYDAPPFTRTRRIRRWIRVGALLTVVGLMPLARAGWARWRLLLAGGLLTVVGVMLHGGLGGVILLFLASAPFVPARPKAARPEADRMRRADLERELGVYSHPAQRRLAIEAMDLHYYRLPGAGRY